MRFLVLFILLLWTLPALAAEQQGRIAYIYDGDTIEVAGVGKVRLIGIDTPEWADSPRDDFYHRWGIEPAHLRTIATRAKDYLISTAKGRPVKLEFDQERRDRHGRLLAYVRLPNGQLLNELLLQKGYASVYRRFDFLLKDAFLQTEQQAMDQRVGLWEKLP